MVTDFNEKWQNCARRVSLALLIFGLSFETAAGQSVPVIKPTTSAGNPTAVDQDDSCFWVHPDEPSQSLVITSDKSANFVFVYDLTGKLLQSLPVPKPGNIDIRQNVLMNGESLDVVVVNQRTDGFALVIFKVMHDSRTLERIDEDCRTDPNYGGCLFQSPRTGRLYFICTSEESVIRQYELRGNNERRITATKVRELKAGKCEGAVADDERGLLYVADETAGVWKFEAEPEGSSTGTLIATVGENGLKGDVEGITIFKLQDGRRWLLISDQGSNRFAVHDVDAANAFLGTFAIDGVGETDGIDVCSSNLGSAFPGGAFACHNGLRPGVANLTPWTEIETAVSATLMKQ